MFHLRYRISCVADCYIPRVGRFYKVDFRAVLSRECRGIRCEESCLMPLADKTLFYHIPKCAGTSVVWAMGIRGWNKVENLYGIGNHFGRKNVSMSHLPAKYLKDVECEHSFSILRDPVDRIQSEFFWAHGKWMRMAKEYEKSVDEVILELCRKGIHSHNHQHHFASMSYFLEGRKDGTRLIWYKSLRKEWSELIDEWGLPWSKALPKINNSRSRGRVKLRGTTKEEIKEIYKEDYDFIKEQELAPVRNLENNANEAVDGISPATLL